MVNYMRSHGFWTNELTLFPLPTLVRGGSAIWAWAHWQNGIYFILKVTQLLITTLFAFSFCWGGGGVLLWGDENNIGNWSSTFGKFHILINPKNNRLASIVRWKHMISIMPEAYDQCKLCSFRISTQHNTHTQSLV